MTAIDATYHRNYVGLGYYKLEVMCTQETPTRSTILSDNALVAEILGVEESGRVQRTAISVKMKASCPYPSPALGSESDMVL